MQLRSRGPKGQGSSAPEPQAVSARAAAQWQAAAPSLAAACRLPPPP